MISTNPLRGEKPLSHRLVMLLQVLSSAHLHPTCDDTCVDMGAPLGYLGVVS